jgi:hypothetical protein
MEALIVTLLQIVALFGIAVIGRYGYQRIAHLIRRRRIRKILREVPSVAMPRRRWPKDAA